jgi:NADPH:quinone reductase-like Zn-dependent oxidoreductase
MEWPAVLGTDGCGVVLDVGEGCTKLKKGDYVFGCSRVGQNSYTPYQDTFLVDEDIIIKKSDNITLEEACTIGVGLEVKAPLLTYSKAAREFADMSL